MTYYDPQAEMYAIGAAIENKADRFEAVKKLQEEDFSTTEYKILFKTIKCLTELSRPVNRRSMMETVPPDDKAMVMAAMERCILLSQGVDADHYINVIKGHSTKRRLVHIHSKMGRELESDKDPNAIINEAQSKLSDLSCTALEKERTFADALASFADGLSYREWLRQRMEKFRAGELTLEGFKTGYRYLDDAINGFENGTYTIVGASTSTGKTTYIINLIMNLLKNHNDASIAFFTLEMTIPQLIHKLIGAYINVAPKRVKNGDLTDEEYNRYLEMEKFLLSTRLTFNNETPATENSIRNNFRRQIHNYGANVMFVDYITKIKSFNRYSSRHLEIDAISATLHDIALEFNIPVIAIAQLSRQLASRTDKRPVLSDLRESGSLEEHADNVLLLHRPKKYDSTKTEDLTEVYIAKNRHDNNLGMLSYEFHHGILVEKQPLTQIAQAILDDTDTPRTSYKSVNRYYE